MRRVAAEVEAVRSALTPAEALGEVLFGLIMALSFTLGARILTDAANLDAAELIVATVGCNIAWGVIDAVLHVLGSLFERNRMARFAHRIRSATSADDAIAIAKAEFVFPREAGPFRQRDTEMFYASIVALTAQADATRIGLRQDDLRAALSVFLLVSACALPAVLPFAVFADDFEALRVSNLALVGLLFITGFRWARHTMLNPWAVGSATAVLGLAMVGVAIALGG